MRLQSLVPLHNTGALTRPDFGLFGLHREIDRLFNELIQGVGPNGGQSMVPKIDISDSGSAVEVSAEMPGLERKDVEISIEDDALTIRGEKKAEEGQKERNIQVNERSYGVFMRVLQLPHGVDPSAIHATMSNGVLKITIPKPARPEPKKIEIKDSSETSNK